MCASWVPDTIERGPGFKEAIEDFKKYSNLNRFGSGLTAAIFGCTGPALIILAAADQGGLSEAETVSWLFAIYVLGGIITLGMALYYKQPICGAYTIPGAVMVGVVLANFNLEQAVGAYFVSGVLVFIIGLSGYFRDVVKWLPQPIIMGMIAGVLIEFAIDMIVTVEEAMVVGGVGLMGYLFFKRFISAIPGIVGAIVFGTGAAVYQGQTAFNQVDLELATPIWVTPEFSLGAIVSITIPLTIIVIGAENMQAIGVLQAEDYDPPINSMLIFSGIGGILASFMGGHNANIAGPMTAITAGEEAGHPKEGRYVASVFDGILFGVFGLVAAAAATLIDAVPGSLIALLAGIAMIGVLISSFEAAFHETTKYRYGTFFALIIGMSGIAIFEIDAAFWALVGGIVVSVILEPDDWSDLQE